MHHRIDSLWKLEYTLTVAEDSILLHSAGETDEAQFFAYDVGLRENVARQLEELPLIFGDNITGKPTITGTQAKGVFRHFISASLTAKNHKICVPYTKTHKGPRGIYSIPPERLDQCQPEKLCFVCRWFGTTSFEGLLYFSFLFCNEPFKNVMSSVIPLIATDEEFGSAARNILGSYIGVKGGTEFKGEISGQNLDEVIIGALFDATIASKNGFIKFGKLKTKGFGTVKLMFSKVSKYSVAPFLEDKSWTGNELTIFLNSCHNKYSEFSKKPSEPTQVPLKSCLGTTGNH